MFQRRRRRREARRNVDSTRLLVEVLEARILLNHTPPDDPLIYDGGGNEPVAGPIGPTAPGMGQSPITYATLANGMPILNSRSGAAGAMFLDFDGDPTLNPNGVASVVYDLDGDTTTFNAAEQANIVETWRKTSLYYAMFDINVTTIQPDTAAVATAWQVISSSWGGGGVAYTSSYPNTFARAWSSASSASSGTQTTIAHESGHLLSLSHQSLFDSLGNQINEYRGAPDTAHGIIIGNSGGLINKWFFGPTATATTLQDDVQAMADKIRTNAKGVYTGDGFAPDDHGNTIALATALPTVSAGTMAATGVIERYTDADVFSFASAGGTYSIVVARDYPSGLDAKISIFDAAGNLIAAQDGNPTDTTSRFNNDQYLTLDLGSGTYYAMIESHGNYSDLGTYLLSVNALPAGWQSQTVGVNAVPGYSMYDAATGRFTIAAGGTDITATSGGMQYAWQTLVGDGSIVARVTGLDGTAALAKTGLMIRDALTTGARFVTMAMTYDRGPELMSRSTVNGAVTVNVGSTSVPFAANWLKLTRTGNVFAAFTSGDGVNWTQYGSNLTISMSATATIGLMTTSAASLALTTGLLTNVTLTGNINPGPTLNALAAPIGVAASNVASTSATISWSAVAGATGYSIERSSDGAVYAAVGSVAAAVTTFNSTGMWDGDRFFFRVRAADAAGVSVASSPIVVQTPPGAATGLGVTAINSGTQLVVNWADVDTETGYRIERSLDQSTWSTVATVAANRNIYVDSGLTANTRFYYRIVSLAGATDAAISTTLTASTRIAAAVTGLAVTNVTTTTVDFAWTGIVEADGYRIDRSTDGLNYTTVTTVSGSTSSFTDTGRAAFTKYYYRVYGVNSLTGSLSQTASTFAITPSTSPLTSPWQFQEFGTLTGTGGSQLSSGTFTVVTSGTALGGSSDRGGMIYQTLVGDASITARVASIGSNVSFTGTTASNAAGVMIRDGLGSNAKFIYARRTNSNTLAVEYRTGTGVSATTVGSITNSSAYFRITRTGNTFNAEYSSNGTSWTSLVSVVLAMENQVYVGMASESDTTALLTNSTFTNVTVTGTNAPYAAAPRGTGTLANQTTAGGQFAPAVAADAQGNYVVAWADAAGGVYARRYSINGIALGSQFRVDSRAGESATSPAVAFDAAGNLVVAWTGSNGSDTNIYAQRYDSVGNTVGTQTTAVNNTTTNLQSAATIAMAPTGAYAIAWVSAGQDGGGDGVYIQRFTNAGVKSGSETRVNTVTTGAQNDPQLTVDSAGNYVVTWTSAGQDGAAGGVYAKRYSSGGTVLTADFLVNQTTAGDQSTASVAAAADGNYLAAWAAESQDGSGYAVVARLYSATGTALTGEFVVNQFAAGDQTAPSVTVDSAGNFLVAWQSNEQDGSGWGVYGRRYSAAGVAVTREFRIHTYTTDDQTAPAAALSAYGTGAVAWQSNNQDGSGLGVYFRIIGNNETPTTSGPTSVAIAAGGSTAVDLHSLFADSSDSDDFLLYSIVGNTNPSALASASVDVALGILNLVAAGGAGSTVLTIRAVDTVGLLVETTVTVTVNAAPPRIIGVYARGAAWSTNYWNYLAAQGMGDAADPSVGYKLSVGANQLRTLAWLNLDTISVRFSDAMTIGQSSLAVVDSVGSTAADGFSWNGETNTATWTLSSPLQAGKYLLHLNDTLTSVAGAALDGEWTPGTSTSSGNGTAGGDFDFRFNVLPGDYDGSNAVAFGEVGQARLSIGFTTGTAEFNYRQDIDGSGSISFGEYGQVRLRLGTSMSAFGEPTAPDGFFEAEPDGGPELLDAVIGESVEASPDPASEFRVEADSFFFTASLAGSFAPMFDRGPEPASAGGTFDRTADDASGRAGDVLERALAAWSTSPGWGSSQRNLSSGDLTGFVATTTLRRWQVAATSGAPTSSQRSDAVLDESTDFANDRGLEGDDAVNLFSPPTSDALGLMPTDGGAVEPSPPTTRLGRFVRGLGRAMPWRRHETV